MNCYNNYVTRDKNKKNYFKNYNLYDIIGTPINGRMSNDF